MTPALNGSHSAPPEPTDLATRVLAHERILQSLIAYMSVTEPRFTNHLHARFVAPMQQARREHDHHDVHDYAEEFVRAVIALCETPAPKKARKPTPTPIHDATPRPPPSASERVTLRHRNGIWQIRVDGQFRGDYCQKEHALAAFAVAKLSLRQTPAPPAKPPHPVIPNLIWDPAVQTAKLGPELNSG